MKWELTLVYDQDDNLVSAYRIFADKTREDLNEAELETIRNAIAEGKAACISL